MWQSTSPCHYLCSQALASQSGAYVKQLKRQSAVAGGDDVSDTSDDDDADEADRVGSPRDIVDGDSASLSGDIAWESLVEKVKTADATSANLRASRVLLPQRREANDSNTLPSIAPTKRFSSIPMLPLNLLIFGIAPLLLAPFYVVIYATTVTAIDEVVSAQVCTLLKAWV
jgi:hypothetical protein